MSQENRDQQTNKPRQPKLLGIKTVESDSTKIEKFKDRHLLTGIIGTDIIMFKIIHQVGCKYEHF